MPIVRIELFPGRPTEVKHELAREITATLERVAGIKPSATTVVFIEVEPTDWIVGGEPFARQR
ncbi:tautomerase family protein [Shinella pollutisoli]|uniref:4-oxalocrotonate tautomerase family protein n=1 Tax=Shinella pollutisoli TaxID=2250594 RepID=A0ABV7DM86_9HYPH|nr:4-oxalocrotonate tautomerase family protein [Shinella pollutisoli]